MKLGLQDCLTAKPIELIEITNLDVAISGVRLPVIALPIGYILECDFYDSPFLDFMMSATSKTSREVIVVANPTAELDHVTKLRAQTNGIPALVAPEFFREDSKLYTNFQLDWIVIGEKSMLARKLANIRAHAALSESILLVDTGLNETDAVKLASNTPRAVPISAFNQLHSCCIDNWKIGIRYSRPSFSYGRYCLCTGSKRLLANYLRVPPSLICATRNTSRANNDITAKRTLAWKPRFIAIHRSVMKAESDNFCNSADRGQRDQPYRRRTRNPQQSVFQFPRYRPSRGIQERSGSDRHQPNIHRTIQGEAKDIYEGAAQ